MQIESLVDPETGLLRAQDGGRDNLVLFTVTYMWLLFDRKEYDAFLFWSSKCFSYLSSDDVMIESGLYRRYPEAISDNSVDNLVGAAASNPFIAQLIVNRGKEKWWCFNAINPNHFDFKYWYGRYIGFAPFVKMAAGNDIGVLSQLLFATACIFSTFSEYGNTSDKCLQLLMNKVVYGRHWLVDRSIDLWRWLMLRKYQWGQKELYFIYFGNFHPFTEMSPKDFVFNSRRLA